MLVEPKKKTKKIVGEKMKSNTNMKKQIPHAGTERHAFPNRSSEM